MAHNSDGIFKCFEFIYKKKNLVLKGKGKGKEEVPKVEILIFIPSVASV